MSLFDGLVRTAAQRQRAQRAQNGLSSFDLFGSYGAMPLFDLASLAKPLVTAPLAHAFLDLDADRRWALGFYDRRDPLTVRQLLSHSAGLPPWLPFTGEPLAAQLRRGFPVGAHP